MFSDQATEKTGMQIKLLLSFGIETWHKDAPDRRYLKITSDSKTLTVHYKNKTVGKFSIMIANSINESSIESFHFAQSKHKNWDIENLFYQIEQGQDDFDFENDTKHYSLIFVEITFKSTDDLNLIVDYHTPHCNFSAERRQEEEEYINNIFQKFDESVVEKANEFEYKFSSTFPNPTNVTSINECSQTSLSNLLGGMIYMYGTLNFGDPEK